MATFQELLSRHIGSTLLKQQALSDFLGKHNWNINLDTGLVDFDYGRVYPIQIIGTVSEISGTWLWGWANEASGIPTQLLTCVEQLRTLGTQARIQELIQPQLDLHQVDGHALTMVPCGVCQADAYYRGPYEGGAVFFVIQQSPLQTREPASPIELVNLMSSIISQFSVDHKVMVRSLLQQQGYDLTEGADKIIASSADSKEIVINFDNAGRISEMQTTAKPASGSTNKKAWWRFGR